MSEPAADPPTPATDPPPAGDTVLEVDLYGEHHRLPWPDGKLLLEVLEEAGLDAPFSCREGHCGACACELLDGEVSLKANETLTEQDLAEGYILACQAQARTAVVRVSYD